MKKSLQKLSGGEILLILACGGTAVLSLWEAGIFRIYCTALFILKLLGIVVPLVVVLGFSFLWTIKYCALATGVPHLGWGSTWSLKSFIAARRRKLKRLPENRKPLAHAQTWYWLGRALFELGQRVPDASTWRESGEAFRQSLSGFRQAGKDDDWADTQVNLAWTLMMLSPHEASKTPLVDAVEALHAAAKVWNKVDNMADWSDIQSALCDALTQLGRMEDGTARLAEAVAAGKAALAAGKAALAAGNEALAAQDNSRAPLANARYQIWLSKALVLLGERESGTGRLEEAVDMARESLPVVVENKDGFLDKDEVIEWRAWLLGSLGQALRCLGERRNDAELLREAVVTLQSTTALRTDKIAGDWAVSQDQLARALLALSQRVAKPDLPSDSLSASDAALGVLTRETYPFDWAVATTTRANTRAMLAERKPDVAALRRAVDDLNAALAIFEQADAPVQRRHCQGDLERVQAMLDKAGREAGKGAAGSPSSSGPMKPRPA